MFWREPEFDEACEIPNEEHDSVADEPDASQCHEIGAEARRHGDGSSVTVQNHDVW